MMTNAGPIHYSAVAKVLHWIIALIIVTMLIFGQGFESITSDDEMAFSLTGHSSLGLTVIALIMLRILWRISHPAPPLPQTVSPTQAAAAKVSHGLLYALMIYVPTTGLYTAAAHDIAIMPYGAFDLRAALTFVGDDDFAGRRFLHELGTWLLIALLAVHIGAALLHQFVQKDGVLRRIWFGQGKG